MFNITANANFGVLCNLFMMLVNMNTLSERKLTPLYVMFNLGHLILSRRFLYIVHQPIFINCKSQWTIWISHKILILSCHDNESAGV